MKIFLLSDNEIWENRLRAILANEKFELVFLKLEDLDADKISSLCDASDFKLVLFNRLERLYDRLFNLFLGWDVLVLFQNSFNESIDEINAFKGEKHKFFANPINYSLLIIEIKSLYAKNYFDQQQNIKCGLLELNTNSRVLIYGSQQVFLKNKEYELVRYMMINQGRVLSRINILENVWDMNSNVMTNTVDVHISKIRALMKNKLAIENVIKTIPCIGYVLS